MNVQVPFSEQQTSAFLPERRPLAMPVRAKDAQIAFRPLPGVPGLTRRRLAVAVAVVAIVATLAGTMIDGLARDGFRFVDGLLLGFYVPNVLINALAAVTALAGLIWGRKLRRQASAPPPGWRPRSRTAVLIPARNEDVEALGTRIAGLARDLTQRGLGAELDLFLLSDSDDPRAIAAEERLALKYAVSGTPGPRLYYRRRRSNEGRKPGNLGDWLRQWGGGYRFMLVLDADSVMSARRIASLIRRMETHPRLGMIQTAVRLTGATSRFGRLQQRAGRLYGGPFAAGLAAWTGDAGNYWGHNALVRVAAFADAAGLPKLSGKPPFGGDILSHDFGEAAWLRRAGWAVEIDPDGAGSAEGGPETVAEFHKRDRRWCQGNMQHLRLIGACGLHPVSRVHLALGIGGYLAAPLWLGLVVVAILAGAVDGMILPAVGAIALILAQKAAGVLDWMARRPGRRTRRIVLRSAFGELALSTLLAPVIMLRQTVAVASVFAGQDCGWKPSAGSGQRAGSDEMPWLEPAIGAALLLAILPGLNDVWQIAFAMPIVLPLVAAPLITAWLDLPPGRLPHAALTRDGGGKRAARTDAPR